MRRSSRIDANQPAIVAGLRAAGCSVLILKDLGSGKPDIAAARSRSRTVLFEIKSKPHAARAYEAEQQKFRDAWLGECYVVYTLDEALAVMNAESARAAADAIGLRDLLVRRLSARSHQPPRARNS